MPFNTPPPPPSPPAIVRCRDDCRDDCAACQTRRARASIKETVSRLAPQIEIDRTRELTPEESAELQQRTASALAARTKSAAVLRAQLRETVEGVTKSGAFKRPPASELAGPSTS